MAPHAIADRTWRWILGAGRLWFDAAPADGHGFRVERDLVYYGLEMLRWPGLSRTRHSAPVCVLERS